MVVAVVSVSGIGASSTQSLSPACVSRGAVGADLRVGEVAGLGSSDACERDAVGALPRQGGGSA